MNGVWMSVCRKAVTPRCEHGRERWGMGVDQVAQCSHPPYIAAFLVDPLYGECVRGNTEMQPSCVPREHVEAARLLVERFGGAAAVVQFGSLLLNGIGGA
jgi:hypothetical protein